jgi:hypothetical protein
MIRRPAELCRELLSALEASDGRRRRRARNTTPDAIGMAIKRELLERAIADDPAPDAFEAWLLEQARAARPRTPRARSAPWRRRFSPNTT